uniref:Cardiotrophin-like cytokine factor 1 n=1 Tax=Rattus norvegicus TaxID=10116 RepID=A0ABK0M4A6_RAT
MFCNCPTELCCLPELSPGLHSQRPPSTSPAWSPGSSGSSSSLPCPMVGILHPDNQHVPPEWLLRGFSLSTPLHRRTHHPTASPVFSMQMTLAGKTRELNYLGPPFNEPDFNPPRLGAETLPRATVNLEVWRSLNDRLRLTQNYEAYSHLLCYLRGLNRQAATAELRRSLAHFCTSLQGLLGSIAGVMATLGYPLPQPLPGTEPAWAPGPAHSDFLQKMDDFWLLKELQTWLWRSAKDFNRLKKKMQPPAASVTLHLEAHGF